MIPRSHLAINVSILEHSNTWCGLNLQRVLHHYKTTKDKVTFRQITPNFVQITNKLLPPDHDIFECKTDNPEPLLSV